MNTEEYQTRYATEPDYIDADGDVYDEDELRERYDDMLDESGMVTIGSLEYSPSEVLKSVDPTAYRVGMSDYQDALGWDEWTSDHERIGDDEDVNACIDCGRYLEHDSMCDECAAGLD